SCRSTGTLAARFLRARQHTAAEERNAWPADITALERGMSTLLISHDEACLNHLTPQGHPERPDRLRALSEAFAADAFKSMVRLKAPMAEADIIALCHPMDYVDAIRNASPDEGLIGLDADTVMSPGSFEAALRC